LISFPQSRAMILVCAYRIMSFTAFFVYYSMFSQSGKRQGDILLR
jgi:hypothetical protein